MKGFLLKIVVFFVCIALIDIASDYLFDFMRSKARGGQIQKYEYLTRQCQDDILILGSSRAYHHYVSSVFEDSLNLSCYNAGEMGCGIIPAYVWYKMVSRRHKPRLVLYDVSPEYDYLQDTLYSRYLGTIRPYCNDEIALRTVLDFSDHLESLCLKSSLYRNNSRILVYLRDIFRPVTHFKGYEPLYGNINPRTFDKKNDSIGNTRSVDSLKFSYMERLICDTRNDSVPLIFVISPVFRSGLEMSDFNPFFMLRDKYGLSVLNYFTSSLFVDNRELFRDEWHLNHIGATIFSQSLIPSIRKFMAKDNLLDNDSVFQGYSPSY